MEKYKSNLFALILISCIIVLHYLLISLNASFKDYVILELTIIFLIGSIGNIVKNFHYTQNKKEKIKEVKSNYDIHLN